ncbi:MAG: cupin domain-containing protein [Terracidiphilus sp.]
MTIVRIDDLSEIQRLPGWFGRYFHTERMTVAHYRFLRDASIHEHFHPQEEVYEVLEGELEITIDGVVNLACPGVAVIVPPGAKHSVRALTGGRLFVVDCPRRPEFDGTPDASESRTREFSR